MTSHLYQDLGHIAICVHYEDLFPLHYINNTSPQIHVQIVHIRSSSYNRKDKTRCLHSPP